MVEARQPPPWSRAYWNDWVQPVSSSDAAATITSLSIFTLLAELMKSLSKRSRMNGSQKQPPSLTSKRNAASACPVSNIRHRMATAPRPRPLSRPMRQSRHGSLTIRRQPQGRRSQPGGRPPAASQSCARRPELPAAPDPGMPFAAPRGRRTSASSDEHRCGRLETARRGSADASAESPEIGSRLGPTRPSWRGSGDAGQPSVVSAAHRTRLVGLPEHGADAALQLVDGRRRTRRRAGGPVEVHRCYAQPAPAAFARWRGRTGDDAQERRQPPLRLGRHPGGRLRRAGWAGGMARTEAGGHGSGTVCRGAGCAKSRPARSAEARSTRTSGR